MVMKGKTPLQKKHPRSTHSTRFLCRPPRSHSSLNADDFSPAGRKQIVTIFGAADIDLPYITLGEEFMWLCYRCFVSRGQESIPLFGQYGHSPPLRGGEYVLFNLRQFYRGNRSSRGGPSGATGVRAVLST